MVTIKNSFILGVLSILPMFVFANLSQVSITQFTKKTALTFAVVDNYHNKDKSFIGQINLNNQSNVSLPPGVNDWALYFHFIRPINTKEIDGLRFEHINGDLHKIVSTKDFKGLSAGDTLTLNFEASVWIAAETDFMPRAFMVYKNGQPVIFSNTDTEDMSQFVLPLTKDNQVKKFNEPKDLTVIANANNRYHDNAKKLRQFSSDDINTNRLIPMPKEVKFKRGQVILNEQWEIRYAGRLTSEVNGFLQDLEKYYHLKIPARPDNIKSVGKPLIQLLVDEELNNARKESYQLEIIKNRIKIIASDNAGAFYGLQSVLGLIDQDEQQVIRLPKVEVKDEPRFNWRGMHYDNARNFQGKAAMFKLIEQMGRYKLNRFHWHFSDDEGWRLEIPGLPELTQVGAHRCFDLAENTCLLTQLGTGPFKSGSGNGFLTRDDFIELLKFAKARHIEIIPEIESPGHARAAIKSMEARYRKLIKAGDNVSAEQYLLSDPQDKSHYKTVQNYNDNAINVCMASSYQFIDKVTYELQQMYREAGVKLNNLHFGGDEVGKGSWVDSPECKKLIQQTGNHVSGIADLKPYFTKRVANLLQVRGVSPGAWEDGLMFDTLNTFNRKELNNETFTANVWDNIWEWGVSDRAYRLANEGFQVILSHGTHLYFDHPYEAHPKERGYYWASRYTSTEKAFSYMPDNVYANADFTREGKRIDNLEALVGRALPKLKKPENILGMQGQIWTETIRTEQQVLEMLFPRVLSVAERAWHKASWEADSLSDNIDTKRKDKDWLSFASALGAKELDKLYVAGIKPYLPVPGAIIEKGQLKVNVSIPNLKLEYSIDNMKSWHTYNVPVSVDEKQKIFVRSVLNKNHKSRITELN